MSEINQEKSRAKKLSIGDIRRNISLFARDIQKEKSPEIKKQKKLATEVLDKIFIMDPDVQIAGGAPRNWAYDKPARDIDVFFRSFGRYNGTAEKQLDLLGFKGGEYADVEKKKMGYPEGIKTIKNYKYFNKEQTEHIDVQFIVLEKDVSIFKFIKDKFDCNSCKISMGHYEEIVTDEFMSDHFNDTLTFDVSNLDANQVKRLAERKAKMLKYFPDRKVIFK